MKFTLKCPDAIKRRNRQKIYIQNQKKKKIKLWINTDSHVFRTLGQNRISKPQN